MMDFDCDYETLEEVKDAVKQFSSMEKAREHIIKKKVHPFAAEAFHDEYGRNGSISTYEAFSKMFYLLTA